MQLPDIERGRDGGAECLSLCLLQKCPATLLG